MNGAFTLYSFETTDSAMYTEGPVRNIYTEDHDTVAQTQATFQRLWAPP